MDYRKLAMNVVESSVALGAVELLNLENMFPSENKLVQYGVAGSAWTLADNALDFYRTGTNDILQMNTRAVVDDVFYNGVVFGGVVESGLGNKLVDATRDSLPLDSRISVALANGALKVGAKLGADLIDAYYPNSTLHSVRRVTSLFNRSN